MKLSFKDIWSMLNNKVSLYIIIVVLSIISSLTGCQQLEKLIGVAKESISVDSAKDFAIDLAKNSIKKLIEKKAKNGEGYAQKAAEITMLVNDGLVRLEESNYIITSDGLKKFADDWGIDVSDEDVIRIKFGLEILIDKIRHYLDESAGEEDKRSIIKSFLLEVKKGL